jgi:hypothetical protein
MIRKLYRTGFAGLAVALLISLSAGSLCAETLNPEGVNPHAAAPRKRITLEQKKAAAEARKAKQAEIAARKAGRKPVQLTPINPADGAKPPTDASGK